MGYRPGMRFFSVELPLAIPVLIAGLRVATVSNISIISIARSSASPSSATSSSTATTG